MTSERPSPKPAPPAEERTGDGPPGSRRGFFWTLGVALGGIALLESLVVAIDFLRPRRRRATTDDDAIVLAGPVTRFARDSVTAFPAGRFYLARLETGGFLALSRECTHLGCTVPWVAAEHRFVCPCHASAYDITGAVVSPPAPRPLDLYDVRIENGLVKVDVSRPVSRRRFDDGQVARP
ncbi:MAG: QcrA and Rieske domain-containing protein [Planctomycetota bacterium]|jgi:cytochrome b6-f complex iron-sulfur subunit